jgi:hypothetical protein
MALGPILSASQLVLCGSGFQPRSSRLEAYSAEANMAAKAGSRSHRNKRLSARKIGNQLWQLWIRRRFVCTDCIPMLLFNQVFYA